MAVLNKGTTLNIITSCYPFGGREVFVGRELQVLSSYFSTIVLFPQSGKDLIRRPTSSNIIVRDNLFKKRRKQNKLSRIYLLLRHLRLVLHILCLEIMKSGKALFIIQKFRYFLNKVLKAIIAGQDIYENIQNQNSSENKFYSIWMDEGALALAILKYQGKIKTLYLRLHGYDLYDYRREGNYMPFQYFIFNHATKISVQTKEAYQYITRKELFQDKIAIHYQGVYDCGVGPYCALKDQPLTLVSCSNLFRLKRVDRIIDILTDVTVPVKWVHFGDGPEKTYLLSQIDCHRSSLQNVQILWKGKVQNEEILAFYKTNHVDLFIHLSETEGGVPVAIQEAMSFGIPAVGTSVGGIPEIINDETGILLPKEYSNKVIVKVIDDFHSQPLCTLNFRHGVRRFWNEHFNASKNYSILAKEFLMAE